MSSASASGGYSSYPSFVQYYVSVSTSTEEPSNNRTLVNGSGYVYCSGSSASSSGGDGSITINGSSNSGSIGYFSLGNGGTVGVVSHSVWVSHDTNGSLSSIGFSGSSTMSGLGSASASGTLTGFANFDRSPTTPTITEGSGTARNAAGTTYTATATGGVNNSGPTVTYTLQRADDAAFTVAVTDTGTTTTSGGSVSATGLTAAKTYYFRIKASNTDGTKYSSVKTSYGVPTAPSMSTITPSTTAEDRVVVNWTAGAYKGAGITYTVKRYLNDGTGATSVATSLADGTVSNTETSAKTAGTSYKYTVTAITSASGGSPSYSSESTFSSTIVAPGIPYAPSSIPTLSKTGRNVTVTSAAVSGNGGVAINTANANEGYFVQYQSATTSGGTYSSWSTPVKMSDQTNRTHTFVLMDAALFYKFRVYAANTVIYASNASTRLYYPHNNLAYTANFATTTTPLFVSAGGRRLRGTGETSAGTWQPTEIAKRYSGSTWVDLSIAKRYDPSYTDPVTGSHWKDLT